MNTLTTIWAPSAPDEVASATPMTRAPSTSAWPHFLTGQTDQPVRVIVVDDDAHMRRVISQELLADAHSPGWAGEFAARGQTTGVAARVRRDVG